MLRQVQDATSGMHQTTTSPDQSSAETGPGDGATVPTSAVRDPASPSVELDFTAVLQQFPDVFKDLPNDLPPVRAVDHKIDLEPGASPPFRGIYRMSADELDELKRQLQDLLAKGFIRPSTIARSTRSRSRTVTRCRALTICSTRSMAPPSSQKLTCAKVTTRSASQQVTRPRPRSVRPSATTSSPS
jgi:hypothetical protein